MNFITKPQYPFKPVTLMSIDVKMFLQYYGDILISNLYKLLVKILQQWELVQAPLKFKST